MGNLILLDDIQEIAEGFRSVMNEVARDKLGRAEGVVKPWSNIKLVEKCEARRNLKLKKNKSAEDAKMYRDANN